MTITLEFLRRVRALEEQLRLPDGNAFRHGSAISGDCPFNIPLRMPKIVGSASRHLEKKQVKYPGEVTPFA
jgi:hypothetical protein